MGDFSFSIYDSNQNLMNKQFIRYGIGIDVGKDDLVVCFKALDSDEQEVLRGGRKFANRPSSFKLLASWIEKHRKDSALPCRILLEVTGVYHEELLYFLYEAGYYVSLELGRRVKNYLKSLGQHTKTDKSDASGLASMVLSRKLPVWKPISGQLMHIRQLVRYRNQLITNKVRYENQLHAHSRCAHSALEVTKGIKRHIATLKADIKQLEQQICQHLKADEQLWKLTKRIVDSLPGVGLMTMATILAETDGFSIFRSAKQLTKYAGLDVIEHQSGSLKGKTRISKQGNARLRTALYMPALALIRSKKSPLYQFYLRLIQRNAGGKKKAIVALQRKLLCLIYALWKTEKPYEPEYQNSKVNNKEQNSKSIQKNSSENKPELHGIVLHKEELPKTIT